MLKVIWWMLAFFLWHSCQGYHHPLCPPYPLSCTAHCREHPSSLWLLSPTFFSSSATFPYPLSPTKHQRRPFPLVPRSQAYWPFPCPLLEGPILVLFYFLPLCPLYCEWLRDCLHSHSAPLPSFPLDKVSWDLLRSLSAVTVLSNMFIIDSVNWGISHFWMPLFSVCKMGV